MESFEALLGFFIFLAMLSLYLPLVDVDNDYVVPQYLLAEDIWRVLYLKYGLFFYYPPPSKVPELMADIEYLSQLTQLCIEYETLFFSYSSSLCPPHSHNVVVIREPKMVGESVLTVSR